ncbi:hypothetical protein ILUMI_12344 [Ignelater luminosus]|uniref:SAP domain-containing protein n=1 Tax=Ignelater luminosus TaxID=2038154 RepID=A0A8K0CUG8_IGNLU|nr:hypothetical protein ILUMI_12344 [Ignelater luminosus]
MSNKIKLSDLKVVVIKSELKKRNLDQTENKKELVNKLKTVLNSSFLTTDSDSKERNDQLDRPILKSPKIKYRYHNREENVEIRIKRLERCSEKPSVTKEISQKSQKPRLLILADSHGCDLGVICKNLTEDKFLVQCLFKPNALFENATSDIYALTKDFNKKDYVVIFAGANNALKGRAGSTSDKLNQYFIQSLNDIVKNFDTKQSDIAAGTGFLTNSRNA